MPLIDVETNLTDPAVRRRLAKVLATWLHRQGVPVRHSLVRYRDGDAAQVYSGPMPFDRLAPEDAPPAFAFVDCRVAVDRDPGFQAEMAGVIARTLVPPVDPDYLFIAFEPVDPRRHYRGRHILEEGG